MANDLNFRRQIGAELVRYFKQDDRYHLLVCDMGFGVLDDLKQTAHDRVTNCGIMEQGTIGIAAGMSMVGLVPIVYSIVNFLVFRAIEQVRNDVVIQKLNVKFLGTGANDYFKFLGPSHCCGTCDIDIMKQIGVDVYDPYTSEAPFSELVDGWIGCSKASYLRV
jgi:transketolase